MIGRKKITERMVWAERFSHAVLVIQNGTDKACQCKESGRNDKDTSDMVPDIVSRFSKENDDLNLDDVKVDDKEDDKQD